MTHNSSLVATKAFPLEKSDIRYDLTSEEVSIKREKFDAFVKYVQELQEKLEVAEDARDVSQYWARRRPPADRPARELARQLAQAIYAVHDWHSQPCEGCEANVKAIEAALESYGSSRFDAAREMAAQLANKVIRNAAEASTVAKAIRSLLPDPNLKQAYEDEKAEVAAKARLEEVERNHSEWERLSTLPIHKAREMPQHCVICKRIAQLEREAEQQRGERK